MNDQISYCGLICSGCPVFLMSEETDPLKKVRMKREIIGMCKEYYGIDYKLEDINDCDGCMAENGRMFFACENCGIRKCAKQKGVENCAYCSDYACKELSGIFKVEPGAKTRLNIIRENF